MSDRAQEKGYEKLSPFELKNELIRLAGTDAERMMLNAGRGNPNWLADVPRRGLFQLGLFALDEAKRAIDIPGFGGSPGTEGVLERFNTFVTANHTDPGVAFLDDAVAHARDQLGIDAGALVFELVDGVLGDHYPTPDRMLANAERIVGAYLALEMCAGAPPPGRFDLFATEGGTAAMAYVFNSLVENKLLHKGDKIALGTPIFTPYLEIPHLNDFELVEIDVMQDENGLWQYPDAEIDRLADPAIKAFFVVHPSNPTSVAMHPDTLTRLADLVGTHRQDLILLTDDVYGTFVNDFRSLAAVCPLNTILVYSYSKYFGATGWRLGVIGIHEDNVFDKAIAALPEADRTALRQRYSTVVLDPDKMKLIDRMVADSRVVALNHTAGLGPPQQVMMTLFSLWGLLDHAAGYTYKTAAQGIVRRRNEILFKALDLPLQEDAYSANYYVTVDVPVVAEQRYGTDFRTWLVDNHEPIDFVWRLAKEKGVVLMDGGGFDEPEMSVRVSLANLPDAAYETIGKAVSGLLADYHNEWKAGAGG
ncbi:bifunctional aspartate transaminase/aspartate 4-decarboxylase [Bauldia sp.]|uniref:bifunctional aspartate transaminase/aspartate 4-decarboxylase n=1 Tax=Bauldia sp. TaxID=2575872 RepID=UPI003BACE3C0